MKGISFGQYYPANSVIHKMDPRFKILVAITFIVATFLCRSAISFLALLCIGIALILISRIPLRTIVRSIAPLLFIIGFTVVINIFFGTGEKLLLEVWGIRIYAEGIWRALFMFLRIFVLITATSVFLTYTTTPMDLTDALESLLSPLKVFHVPVHVFAMMMSITLRFIPTLTEETEKIMNAQKARGADFETGSLVKRVKAIIPVLIPLLVSSFRRADELGDAMDARCYSGSSVRTKYKKLCFGWRDILTLVFFTAFLVGVILLKIYFPAVI